MSVYQALDTLMSLYLGQDSFYFTGEREVSKCIDFYLKNESDETKAELLEELFEFVDEHSDALTENFNRRYRHSIYDHENVSGFLELMNDKVSQHFGVPAEKIIKPPRKTDVVFTVVGGDVQQPRSVTSSFTPNRTRKVPQNDSELLLRAVAELGRNGPLLIRSTAGNYILQPTQGIIRRPASAQRKARLALGQNHKTAKQKS